MVTGAGISLAGSEDTRPLEAPAHLLREPSPVCAQPGEVRGHGWLPGCCGALSRPEISSPDSSPLVELGLDHRTSGDPVWAAAVPVRRPAQAWGCPLGLNQLLQRGPWDVHSERHSQQKSRGRAEGSLHGGGGVESGPHNWPNLSALGRRPGPHLFLNHRGLTWG